MATVVANTSVNLSAGSFSDVSETAFDGVEQTVGTPTEYAFLYTLASNPVFSASLKGSFQETATDASGTISSFVISDPAGVPQLTFDNVNKSFANLAEFEQVIQIPSLLSDSDVITGSASSDIMTGYSGNDAAHGGDGTDAIYGNRDSDQLFGDAGSDSVFGGQQADNVSGGAGDDAVYGNMDNDVVAGDDGNDVLFGGKGGDLMDGGLGDDALSGDLDNDTLTGGAGADRFAFRTSGGADVVTDFNFGDGDRLNVSGRTYTVANGAQGATVDLGGGDSITLVGVSAEQVNAAWFISA